MKKVLIIAICILIICGCNDTNQEYKRLMKENDYIIIDVRTKEEYNDGHIKNAINIPYDEINEEIDINKDKLIFVYCKSGNRSKIAYNTLTSLGYNVYDLGSYQDIDLEKE